MEPFLGQITLFPFSFAPTGWALCEGQLLSISQNTALFSLWALITAATAFRPSPCRTCAVAFRSARGKGPGCRLTHRQSAGRGDRHADVLAVARAFACFSGLCLRGHDQRPRRRLAGRGTWDRARRPRRQHLRSARNGGAAGGRPGRRRRLGRRPQQSPAESGAQLVHRFAGHIPVAVLMWVEQRRLRAP